MNDTIEANVDAKEPRCRCCGDELESKEGGHMCGACTTAGCDPATSACLVELGV